MAHSDESLGSVTPCGFAGRCPATVKTRLVCACTRSLLGSLMWAYETDCYSIQHLLQHELMSVDCDVLGDYKDRTASLYHCT